MTGKDTVWTTVSASVRGPSHVQDNLRNQDNCLVRPITAQCTFFAVADGAGSYSRAEEGSKFAVTTAYQAAEQVFKDRMPQNPSEWSVATKEFANACLHRFDDRVADFATQQLAHFPAESVQDIRESLSTTLLAVVARPPFFVYFSIGDCFLVLDRDRGGPRLAVTARDRENNGVATFLTSPERDADLQSGYLVDRRVTGLALCSDGLIDALLTVGATADGELHYQAPAEFRRYFEYFGRTAIPESQLANMLDSPTFAETSSDDKTIALAVRLPKHTQDGPYETQVR
ncbi:PP2C family serine/threonine-protein phosphatase [Nocardia bovistercoris]|uniref:Protein phosphatase 2C domain-containing protein n=1 Tax=Nocardia bovistercoris TaxID=2785916 RepID=A0A931I8T6_9NOCA|nr:PP2C family serine/threonine-protein phosphatase [Nocardia bovistercoris]MBH0775965.1 protein phosphatase 2C domain-containing protein [Nocardia bovistercoris]